MMTDGHNNKPDYGNWVATKSIYIPLIAGFVFTGAATVFWPVMFVTVLCFLAAGYFAMARYLLGADDGALQDRVWGLVVDHLRWDGKGKALDIGCGNGPLTIKVARYFPEALVTGCDYWGKAWDYALSIGAGNAVIEGVGDRVHFQMASASKLPFDDGYFDAVVSNLTFHEVKDTKNKEELIREALRVLKKGGRFAFQDLFFWRSVYDDPTKLLATVKSWGTSEANLTPTYKSLFIPRVLKLPFMLGTMGMISGIK
jgi:ubiquinone/menaquinone biosynthesis C-methylase UbiE